MHRIAANIADFVFRLPEYGPDELKVSSFNGEEGLSRLFHFRVELVSDDPAIDLDAQLGAACSLSLYGDFGTRVINGVVNRFELIGTIHERTRYAAEFVPVHWYLTKRSHNRIFQLETCTESSDHA